MGEAATGYRPRRPQAGALHQAVREGWPEVSTNRRGTPHTVAVAPAGGRRQSLELPSGLSVVEQVGGARQLILALCAAPALYALAAALLNRVRIRVRNKQLRITEFPVPMPARRLPRGEVTQLFCEKQDSPEKGEVSWTVSALVGPDRRRVRLIENLRSVDHALAVEQALERALGIIDAQVGGEVPR